MTHHVGPLHCVYCSARLTDGATFCAACRSPVVTLAAAPIPSGVRCPRCKARNISGAVAARRSINAECGLLECASCGGAFVEPHSWSGMLEGVLAGDAL